MTTMTYYDAADIVDAYTRQAQIPLRFILDTRMKSRSYAHARQQVVWLLVQLAGVSIGEAADHLDFNRSHTTTQFYKHYEEVSSNDLYRATLSELEAAVRRGLHE